MPRVRLFALLVIAMCGVATGSGQERSFRTGTDTVSVYASVVDRGGRLVADLTKDDFEVYDDGKRQDITLFANDAQPITMVVMLDRSGSMVGNFGLVRDAAVQLVTRLDPGDKARIGSFSNRVEIDPPQFTSDHQEMIRILHENLQPAGATPLWNATAMAMTAVTREQGRRVVLVFTDGYDNPGRGGFNISLGEVRDRLLNEDLMLYAIGFAEDCKTRGVKMVAPSTPLFQRRVPGRPRFPGMGGRRPPPRGPIPFPPVPGRGLPPPAGGDPSSGGIKPSAPPYRPCFETAPDPALKQLAVETGGGYFELSSADDLGATFTRVVDELHQQYLLGFTPANLDGKNHTIEVRLRNSDATVRARQSYLAAAK
jgi:VWFA-related protein